MQHYGKARHGLLDTSEVEAGTPGRKHPLLTDQTLSKLHILVRQMGLSIVQTSKERSNNWFKTQDSI